MLAAAVPWIRMAGGKPQKEQVIDALVLAFARSDLSAVVGSDALRSVLAVEYHDMVSDGVFDMALLWELLEEQAGFDPALAMPPLCSFKSWESRMGLEVQLPTQLAELSDKDRALHASECRVSPAELRTLFGDDKPGGARESQKSGALRDSQKNAAEGGGTAARATRERPVWLGWVASVVAVGTFAFCSMTLYGYCNQEAQWSQASELQLGKQLPVSRVDRLGTSLRAQVEPAWNRLDTASRTEKLRKALLEVEAQGVKAIALVDEDAVIATVQRTRTNDVDVWLRNGK